jgi:hypothetical protein
MNRNSSSINYLTELSCEDIYSESHHPAQNMKMFGRALTIMKMKMSMNTRKLL